MSENKNINSPLEKDQVEVDSNLAVSKGDVASVTGRSSTATTKLSTTAERQIKFERAQKCLENAALVSKKIKEHRKATAELLGRPFEDDTTDTQSEMATAVSEKTGYSVATDTSTTLSVQDALNIPGISESLANTLKQKEILMERIKQYKEISKRPRNPIVVKKKELALESTELSKSSDPSEVSNLMTIVKDKENALSVMQVKLRAMETTILDLQEKINEKDQIIEAKNKATTLISDSLTKKEKDTLHLLEDTKEQMSKMQQNFVTMESEWKEEKLKLLSEIEEKNEKIKSLSEANTILENSRFEISIAHSKLIEELELKNQEIKELQEQISKLAKTQESILETEPQQVEEKGSKEIADMEELTKKIELLEQINYQIRQTNKELENQLTSVNLDPKPSTTASSPSKKGSPLPTRKGGRNTSAKLKSPWSKLSAESLNQEPEKKTGKADAGKTEIILQALNKDILEKEYAISQKEAVIINLQADNKQKDDIINELKSQIISKTVEKVDVEISTEKIKEDETYPTSETSSGQQDVKDLEEKLKLAQEQIASLNEEIDAANKNMIKVKSNSKLKLKQMQKTIENFSKVSDTNAEILRLNEEIHQLSQKVAELEEEKGNLQLHLVDYDSGRLTDTEVYKKMVEMENLAETRLKSISLLETQKFDLVQELHLLQQKNAEMEDKLADISQLQNEQVCSEIKSVQLEEQIDELTANKKELELVIENIKLDKEQLEGNIKLLQSEKEELLQKLENYIQENMELTDKLEKLSAEKVSSAESIEIVDSLTTQEKLEIEEYNKGIDRDKLDDNNSESQDDLSSRQNITIDSVLQESAELKNKIELFTQERQEVMEKMNTICTENNSLHKQIEDFEFECQELKQTISILNNEKSEIQMLNEELNSQIEELKRERIEIIKETAETTKPLTTEDSVDSPLAEIHHDDKAASDKGAKGTKSVKQLTKEILKLKNVIKEREDEIADCQMKILSLEEQHQKHSDLLKSNMDYENKIKQLTEENKNLKLELDTVTNGASEQQQLQLKDTIESLHQEIQKIQREYSAAITSRDANIQNLEQMLREYEKQVFNYGNSLQQKDKEINEYINQITKLNDLSQKLKSRIESLEDEKAKDQNSELIKSLNKQIALYQNALADCEEKLRMFEEEKAQLSSLKSKLENKNNILETDLTNLKQTLNEKQKLLEELQLQQQKQKAEYLEIMTQSKERDEEIHEIKLQLRKESIENEKLRTAIQQKDLAIEETSKQYEQVKQKLDSINLDQSSQSDQFAALESKNKELMEKLKKFALSIKKKSSMYTELEHQFSELQKQYEIKMEQYEQAMIQVETIPALQEKIKYANEELNNRQAEKNLLDKKNQEIQSEITSLQYRYEEAQHEIIKLNERIDFLNKDLYIAHEENANVKSNLESLNNKLVEYELEQKNNTNLLTKISCLEADINQKQSQISDLMNQLQNGEQSLNQMQFGHEAKIQERDMYIENLQIEMEKYKNRICRLEESISEMENRRQSLERKADQLDTQLQEKRKSYSEYTTQEDELITRLAVLMDHDRVLEKQVHEIENDNKELQYKVQYLNEELQNVQKSYSDLQVHCKAIESKAAKTEILETENMSYHAKIESLENNLKKITNEHNSLLAQRKVEIDEIETEFNTQIEEAIKEKKLLSEKLEKLNEHLSKLEYENQGYKTTIANLHINLEELTSQNIKLAETSKTDNPAMPDYTEQYVAEINKLNAALNNKNAQLTEYQNKLQNLQAQHNTLKSSLEQKITELSSKLAQSSYPLDELTTENAKLKCDNQELANLLYQKEDQIKQLMEKKKVVFEMNIPKTEGMTISSTIEEMSDEQKSATDISSLQSQILSDADISNKQAEIIVKKELKHSEKPSNITQFSEGSIEPLIVPKKTYVCFQKDDEIKDEDPFNSEEGWGLEENADSYDVTPGTSKLNQEIQSLKETNERLKKELDASNAKLLKAIKKLKELKAANDMLANELKLSKQISNSSLLDMAIESELANNMNILEKKVQELNDALCKEKKEKEVLTKQNEVFKNANERLIEMKEKMDNEVELWKYNFKQANDKLSSQKQCVESQDNIVTPPSTVLTKNETQFEEEVTKLEKENEELQSIVDNISQTNKELTEEILTLKSEVANLNEKCMSLAVNEVNKAEIEDLKLKNKELSTNCSELQTGLSALELQNNELTEKSRQENIKYKSLENKSKELFEENSALLDKMQLLRVERDDAINQIQILKSDLENVNMQLQQSQLAAAQIEDMKTLTESYEKVQSECEILKQKVDNASKIMQDLELENRTLLQNAEKAQEKINELESKLQQLNSENDELLSTVTELRSSISSAMDQRGFEIAELWKQHLAQRENDFQQIEQDLRSQLNASESKYQQLLDYVQSSTQEETNKIVIIEQVSSLQNKLQEKEDQLNSLHDKYTDVMHQLEMLRSEMEDEKLMNENKILVQQEEYEKTIKELRGEMQKRSEQQESTDALNLELVATKTVNDSLNQRIDEINREYESKISDLNKQIKQKESEIFQKTHDFTITLLDRNTEFENVRKQLIEYEKKVEDLTYEKESELAVLRLKMHENDEHYEKMRQGLEEEKGMIAEALNAKIVECTNLNKQINDLNKILEEYANKAAETQLVLESQEIEIVTLKDEIESMKNALRSASNKIEKHVTFASGTKEHTGNVSESTLNKELLDAVPRAELDLALYMLHQRDVRCEELTMELTQLLEERDTLQLRLSDSLRSYEELKARYGSVGLDVSTSSSQDTVSELPSFSIEKESHFVDTHRAHSSRSSSISEMDGEKPKLQAKLSELRSVKHSRDVRLRHDSEQRQLGMRLLSRDVANLPPEAVEQLNQAHHTLSRDSQSTPTVLLNWLRGKSTPKVVHM
ncbi:protein lava lamp-like [Colias croceus]|uniref:protein lava lamp-like n=1 Tax=Colias crocea TaxID=72248 RepID=UPI001E27A094|nr:protein lava lamp-like [Colias croceus]